MKDLRITYQTGEPEKGKGINIALDEAADKLAESVGLSLQNSGLDVVNGIRHLHYGKEK